MKTHEHPHPHRHHTRARSHTADPTQCRKKGLLPRAEPTLHAQCGFVSKSDRLNPASVVSRRHGKLLPVRSAEGAGVTKRCGRAPVQMWERRRLHDKGTDNRDKGTDNHALRVIDVCKVRQRPHDLSRPCEPACAHAPRRAGRRHRRAGPATTARNAKRPPCARRRVEVLAPTWHSKHLTSLRPAHSASA